MVDFIFTIYIMYFYINRIFIMKEIIIIIELKED